MFATRIIALNILPLPKHKTLSAQNLDFIYVRTWNLNFSMGVLKSLAYFELRALVIFSYFFLCFFVIMVFISRFIKDVFDDLFISFYWCFNQISCKHNNLKCFFYLSDASFIRLNRFWSIFNRKIPRNTVNWLKVCNV